jgi:hypothetical protein
VTEEGFWVAQIVVGAIGLAVLLAYTVFTAGLFLKARGQLSELKRTADVNKEALDLAQAEFRARTRPWLAVEKITSGGERLASELPIQVTVRNRLQVLVSGYSRQ